MDEHDHALLGGRGVDPLHVAIVGNEGGNRPKRGREGDGTNSEQRERVLFQTRR